jgi:uncharacterized membrane protein
MKPNAFQSAIDQERVIGAITAAEAKTSGEIGVVVSLQAVDDAMVAARAEFVRLGMTATRQRNAVLIFIAPRSQQFAVVGDEGVHRCCGDGFWSDVAGAMAEHFRAGDYTTGLVEAIARTGTLLAEHFPRRGDDINELPDTVAHV